MKHTITASMVYVGILALLATGWLKKIRTTVQSLSGSSPSIISPSTPGSSGGGSGFDGGSAGGGNSGGGGGAW